MKYPKDRNIHRPPHLLLDNEKYFITSRTVDWLPFFRGDEKKKILHDCIFGAAEKFNYTCDSWVILDNHYQLVIEVKDSQRFPLFIKQINGGSSKLINEIDNLLGRKIWDQYWDTILDNEKDYRTHINYNHHNPVKHGYVKKMEDYRWSSLNEHINKYGQEAVYEIFKNYPVVDFTPPWDE